jgi:hypothetical protein
VLLLFGSRILIIILMLCGKTRAPGGVLRCILSMLIEMVASTCLAPMFAIITLWSTIKILRGQGSGWDAQDREGRAISWVEVVRSLGAYGLVAALVPIIYIIAGAYNASLSSLPFFLSVVLAVPLAKLSSAPRGGAGDWTRKHQLFMSPYEEPLAPETDLDGAESCLKAELDAYTKELSTRASSESGDSSILPADLERSSSLGERLASWSSSGKVHVGMRHNSILSHAAAEVEGAKASDQVPLMRSETEKSLLVDIEQILAAEPDADINVSGPETPSTATALTLSAVSEGAEVETAEAV